MARIVTKKEFRENIRPLIKADNKNIALCHGVFDLVHPGHMDHFEQASKMADVLVVSITAAKYVRKGPDRPYFNDNQRLKFLANIDFIDYVMLSEGYTVDDIVEAVEPDFYVKGSEYADENADVTANMKPERELVEKHGGKVAYTGGDVFSSTKLINRGMSALPEDVIAYMEKFKEKYSMQDILNYADQARKLRVLVIGDVIIDRYTFCTVQGLMSKNTAYSARESKTEDYLGGSVAVARHISGFCNDVTLMSVIGNEDGMMEQIQNGCKEHKSLKLNLIQSREFPTIVKHRYVSENKKREEYEKVFVSNNIPMNPRIDRVSHNELKNRLQETLDTFDAVFVCDFGHGLLDDDLMDVLQDNSKFLILNCQTNSSNYGLNNITKYHKADAISLDQKELKLAFPQYAEDECKGIDALIKTLQAKFVWLTRGSDGALGAAGLARSICPAFTNKVSDTIGAGDAFYSIAGLFTASGAEMEITTMIGNIAGAIGTNIVGNKSSVGRADVLKFAGTMMNV